MEQLSDYVSGISGSPWFGVGLIMAGAFLALLLVRYLVFPLLTFLTRKTRSDVDDDLLLALRPAVMISLLLVGAGWSVNHLGIGSTPTFILTGLIKTVAVLIWSSAGLRVGAIFLQIMSRNRDRLTLIQPKTLPLLQIAWKALVVGAAMYFLLAAWRINPTSWLASAGIVGIAVGFAAKDTLANLFAGLFIVADAPFKIGDYVILDQDIRGEITDIGFRSSRLLTRDDIEVTVPNAVIANGQIVNETGGPHQKMRVRVSVSVAYGSDVDEVVRILLACPVDLENVVANPAPRVRLREFGASGLRFELLAWIEQPVFRGRVLDKLNTAVYKAFGEAGIEIPFPKQDLYIKEMPVARPRD